MAERWVLEYDSREPAGPMRLGPFPSREAAEAGHEAQRVESAEWCVWPLTDPVERTGLPRVVIDVEAGRLLVDGEEFPLPYIGADPVIAEAPDGTVYPGVSFTVACADVQVVKPSEVIPPDAGE